MTEEYQRYSNIAETDFTPVFGWFLYRKRSKEGRRKLVEEAIKRGISFDSNFSNKYEEYISKVKHWQTRLGLYHATWFSVLSLGIGTLIYKGLEALLNN